MIKKRYHRIRPKVENIDTIIKYVNRFIDKINNDRSIIFGLFYENMDIFLQKAFNRKTL